MKTILSTVLMATAFLALSATPQLPQGYELVGGVPGTPTVARFVEKALDAAKIGYIIFGSRGYGINVQKTDRKRTIDILTKDARLHGYRFRIIEPKK